MESFKIPQSFEVGGQKINVNIVEKLEGLCGDCNVVTGVIRIAKNCYEGPQSPTSIENTFWHELTHSILTTMGELELNKNEIFVNTFASFLYSTIKSFNYENDNI